MDLEDFGVVIASNKQQALANTAQQEQPMVNSDIRADLENKGYHIIGTHSAARLNSCAEVSVGGWVCVDSVYIRKVVKFLFHAFKRENWSEVKSMAPQRRRIAICSYEIST